MHLSRVTIENYRGFTSLTVDLDETTVLIGENNTGKSSIFEAVRLCLSRPLSRRGNPFEDHDYHLASDTAKPGDAGPLRLTLDFAESKTGEWPPDIIQALSDAVVLHPGDLYHATLRVTSTYDRTVGDFVVDWDFLDPAGQPLVRAKRPAFLVALQQFNPIYYLSALREAARDFGVRSTFWAPFLRNPSIPVQDQQKLEKELADLNDRIVKAEPRLGTVKQRLDQAQKVVSLGKKDTVTIEAIPGKIWEMLSKAQVNVASVTGAALPLARHGAGTQSLAGIFLYQAFVEAGVGKPDPYSEPILEIEEPEAHLHPSAIRALWSTLDGISGQKIVATHSGDLLSEVPLSNIRRFRRVAGNVEVRRVGRNTLTDDDARKMQFHVRRTRGELLFARCWLMHEGETEYWIFSACAMALKVNLEEAGVRLVEYADVGIGPFAKLADDLGIEWHCVCDGDPAGQKNKQTVVGTLKGRKEASHVSTLAYDDIEALLCNCGLGAVYEANIDPNKRPGLTAKPGDPLYWKQVLSCQPRGFKTRCAVDVAKEIVSKGAQCVPKDIQEILKKAQALAT